MNELTMVLDELESRLSSDTISDYPQMQNRHLTPISVQKLVTVLQAQDGEMARIASVIEDLAADRPEDSFLPRYTAPTGSVTMPGDRNDVRTLTAGNGVMNAAHI